jgi:hypothetical protein
VGIGSDTLVTIDAADLDALTEEEFDRVLAGPEEMVLARS